MLRKKFFHRAKKIPVSEQELKARSKKKEKKTKDKEDSGKKDKSEVEEEKKVDEAESSHAEEKKEKVKKEKRKIRLDMHLEQQFVDGNDAYVWIYDPVPYYYWIAGGAVVLAVVALCLFPLWPPIVRQVLFYPFNIWPRNVLIFIQLQERSLLLECCCGRISHVYSWFGYSSRLSILSPLAGFNG